MLEVLGLTADQQRVYEIVLTRPSWTTDELALTARLDPAHTADLLTFLDQAGLVVGADGRWTRVPPDSAIESYIVSHHQRLHRVRALIPALMTIYDRATGDSENHGPVELLRGHAAIGRRWAGLQRAARFEVCQFERPPYVAGAANEEARGALAAGVVYRTVYDASYVDCAHVLDALHRRRSRGERIRVLPGLPTKLGLVDRRWAILPVAIGHETDSALLVSASALLTGLRSLFEHSWQRAAPLPGQHATPGVDWRVLELLAAGLTDKTIALRMGVSLRTAQRHVRALMDTLGATSRFQAGLRAAALGLLDRGMLDRGQRGRVGSEPAPPRHPSVPQERA
ncbi:helix-turn-helix transcriptional regulator [Crossiella cryophila]|uniref:Transcription initiation factor IIE alpha subunit n=1 Tax=Crossiella cryophila TaxID=43355 RepID=A0A7W7CH44_9PSEU|nr:helix-turn-helix transcriptional regulator [Crossiella cryophila]MBB4681104.1 transcription initiation factor IIE alpha subunit [Crossiella cryophila]